MTKLHRALVLTGALLLASCAADIENASAPATETETKTASTAVPLDKALDEMYSLMATLYGPETRGAERKIAGIETLSAAHLGGATCSDPGDGQNDGQDGDPREDDTRTGNLYYIVNFENDGGFAILGADTRSETVLCITESGSATLGELLTAGLDPRTRAMLTYTLQDLWTPYDEMPGYVPDPQNPDTEEGEYLIGSAADDGSFVHGALLAAIRGPIHWTTPPDYNPLPPPMPDSVVYGEWTDTSTKVGPLLGTMQ